MRKAVLFLSAFLVVSGSLWANTISVDEYVRQVRANSLRTEGRTFTIKGVVDSASIYGGGRVAVRVRGDGGGSTNLKLSREGTRDQLGLAVGDVITFTGVSSSEYWLEDASILEVERSSAPFRVAPSYTGRELTEQVLNNILRFHGEVVQATVRVHQVSRAYNGISIYASDGWYGLSFLFSSAHFEALSNLNAGDMVTIRTRVSATEFDYFLDSELVPNP